MTPEERLRRLRDDDRWEERPFVLRPARRSAPRPVMLATAFAGVAVVLLLVLGVILQRPIGTPPPVAAPAATPTPAVPWTAQRPGTGPLTVPRPVLRELPLTADLAVPAAAQAGAALEYRVTLSNPTSRAVPLTPCPVYRESVAPRSGAAVVTAYVLNCRGVGALAPGASAVFAMRVPVPSGTAGPATVRWTLTGGPSATGATTVRGGTR